MSAQSVYQRKVGAFELAVGCMLAEGLFGTAARVALFAVLAAGLYYAKRHFKGEFSLADLRGLFREEEKQKETKPS
ncbi:MAG TPA: hypothetical protein VGK73_13120 [Polyangiaceae bacterium]